MIDAIIPLVTLIALEVILGIDNIIFISILASKMPEDKRDKLRLWGIGLALIMRLILLAFISWILKLDKVLFEIGNIGFSGKSLILLGGGLFLLFKSTKEIFHHTEVADSNEPQVKGKATFQKMLGEIIILDLVFSIDSIITAVGMVSELWIMYTAVIITVIVMLIASKPISDFIKNHPSFKILALSFLLMIGVTLVAEGLSFHIPKGYIYFSMAFAFLVDILQMKTVDKQKLNKPDSE